MSDLRVDTDALLATADELRQAQEAADGMSMSMWGLPGLGLGVGHAAVRDAVTHFVARWQHGLGCLRDDCSALREQLEMAAAGFTDVETQLADSLVHKGM